MNPDIKPALLSDLNEIVKMWMSNMTYHHDMAPEYYVGPSIAVENILKEKVCEIISKKMEYLYYIELANQKVGFIYFGSDSPKYFDCVVNRFGVIHEIYILNSFQNQGLGHLLMQYAENKLKKEGFTYVFLQLTAVNVKAKEFYLRNQYHESQIIMNKKL